MLLLGACTSGPNDTEVSKAEASTHPAPSRPSPEHFLKCTDKAGLLTRLETLDGQIPAIDRDRDGRGESSADRLESARATQRQLRAVPASSERLVQLSEDLDRLTTERQELANRAKALSGQILAERARGCPRGGTVESLERARNDFSREYNQWSQNLVRVDDSLTGLSRAIQGSKETDARRQLTHLRLGLDDLMPGLADLKEAARVATETSTNEELAGPALLAIRAQVQRVAALDGQAGRLGRRLNDLEKLQQAQLVQALATAENAALAGQIESLRQDIADTAINQVPPLGGWRTARERAAARLAAIGGNGQGPGPLQLAADDAREIGDLIEQTGVKCPPPQDLVVSHGRLKTELAAAQRSYSELVSRVADLDDRQRRLADDIEVLRTTPPLPGQIAEVEVALAGLNSDMTGFEEDVDGLGSQVSGLGAEDLRAVVTDWAASCRPTCLVDGLLLEQKVREASLTHRDARADCERTQRIMAHHDWLKAARTVSACIVGGEHEWAEAVNQREAPACRLSGQSYGCVIVDRDRHRLSYRCAEPPKSQ